MRRLVWGACLALIPWVAQAGPGLGGKVYAPTVKPGFEIEMFGGRLVGGPEDGEWTIKTEFEYGFSRRFMLGLVTEVEDEPGDDAKLEAVAIEGIGYLGRFLGVDTGAYLEYEQRLHNQSGIGEAKLLLGRSIGPVRTRFNFIAKHAFTDQKDKGGTEFEYAASALAEVSRGILFGVEAFGDLGSNRHFGGSQEHYVGPVAKVILIPTGLREIELQGGYLFPAGAASRLSDGELHFELELEF